MSRDRHHVLALQLRRIGDLLLTTPALWAMRQQAGARVTLILSEGCAPLRSLLGSCADEVLVVRRQAAWSNLRLAGHVARGLFDDAVDFTGNDRSALLTRLSGANRRVVARDTLRRAPRWRHWAYNAFVETPVRGRHTVDRHLEHLAGLRLAQPETFPVVGEGPPGPVLSIPEDARQRVRTATGGLKGRYAVVHPGSARAEKYWRPERWAEVIRFLQDELALPVVLTGGRGDPFEDEHLAGIRRAGKGVVVPRTDLAGKLDLPALAALVDEATLFVGVDSGPMHLAAAARVPCVVLFGPTNPFHWRPRHATARVLQAGHGDAPVTEFLPVSPAGKINLIPVSAVTATCATLLV